MTTTIDLAPILALPVTERLKIADAIYDSIPEGELPPGEISDELKEHLDRRLQEIEDNPGAEVSWEEIERDALARRRG